MRPWGIVLIAGLALLGLSLPGLAPPVTAIPSLTGLGTSLQDLLPMEWDANVEDEDEDDDDEDDEEDDDADDQDDDEDDEDDDDEDDEDDEDDDDDDDFEDEEREVLVEIVDEEVNIELESKSEGREDEVKVQFDAGEGEMRVSFETAASKEEEVEMRIAFRELLEFEDEGDEAFSPLGDQVLQSFEIATLEILDLRQEPLDGDPTTGRRISVTYRLPTGTDGTFELVFWVSGLVTEIEGVPVRPTETKIDIIIRNFPFISTTSRLALGLEVKTEFEIEEDPGVTFEQIVAAGDEFSAFFQWMPDEVMRDGTPASAEVTFVRERKAAEVEGKEGEFEKETRLFLAYPRGAEIVHDPIVGIMADAIVPLLPATASRLAVFAVGLATALLLVFGVWALNRRRR